MINPQLSQSVLDKQTWLKAMKAEIRRVAATSKVVQGGIAGDVTCTRIYWKMLWPFVDRFPRIIGKVKQDMIHIQAVTPAELALYSDAADVLRDMKEEELSHRDLWWIAAERLGLTFDDLDANPTPDVRRLIEAIGDDADLVRTLLKLVAVEMVAESVSHLLAPSEAFRKLHLNKPVPWMQVHLNTEVEYSYTHEWLCFQLAERVAAIQGRAPIVEVEAWDIILHIAQLFRACEDGLPRISLS